MRCTQPFAALLNQQQLNTELIVVINVIATIDFLSAFFSLATKYGATATCGKRTKYDLGEALINMLASYFK